MNRLKRSMLIVLFVLMLLAGGVWLFMQTAVFGADPTADRLLRVQASKNYRDGSFQNPVPTDVMRPGASYWNWVGDNFRKPADVEPRQPLPSVKTNLNELPDDEISIVWFGHSSYLIKSGGTTVLVDPVFSGYASPVPFFGKAFPGANVCSVADMPPIDLLIITHDHYDHLDYETVVALRDKVKRVVTSLGVGAHLERWGYDPTRITELDWDESVDLSEGFSVTAVPARHFSGRGIRRGRSLWSAFVLDLNDRRLFLGGDSGYGPHFAKIGREHGPFDVALLECGQYGRDWPTIHMFPHEVPQAARDLNARVLLPVHWAKFALAFHPWSEPVRLLTKAMNPADSIQLTTPKIGEPVTLGRDLPKNRWWE